MTPERGRMFRSPGENLYPDRRGRGPSGPGAPSGPMTDTRPRTALPSAWPGKGGPQHATVHATAQGPNGASKTARTAVGPTATASALPARLPSLTGPPRPMHPPRGRLPPGEPAADGRPHHRRTPTPRKTRRHPRPPRLTPAKTKKPGKPPPDPTTPTQTRKPRSNAPGPSHTKRPPGTTPRANTPTHQTKRRKKEGAGGPAHHQKTQAPRRRGPHPTPSLLYEDVRRRPTLPHPTRCSTIGAGRLNDRVRNVTGCFPSAITAVTPRGKQPSWLLPENHTANASLIVDKSSAY